MHHAVLNHLGLRTPGLFPGFDYQAKRRYEARHWWLTPDTLTTSEAEIWRTAV
jgi:hypothetical protein